MTLKEFEVEHERRMKRINEITKAIEEFCEPLKAERKALIDEDLEQAKLVLNSKEVKE